MNVSIYHQPHGSSMGGSEVVTATIASILHEHHAVTIHQHRPDLSSAELARFAGVDLEGVKVVFDPVPKKRWQVWDAPVWKLPLAMRRWQAALSEGSDLFLASLHAVPPFNHAAHGALYIHFPLFDRHANWPWNAQSRRGRGQSIRGRLRRWGYERLWRWRLAGYKTRLANSHFTARWTEAYWGCSTEVVYPPVAVNLPARPKRNTIITLGRFTAIKRQRDLIEEFQRVAAQLPGWELVCVGAVGSSSEDQEYFDEVRAAVTTEQVRLLTDVEVTALRQELAEARIFWHATGFGIDAATEPARLEHFGMATVEAMAAGCVPLVPNSGGQVEIVRHGVDGYLCDGLKELGERTVELTRNPSLLERLAASTTERARAFSREQFVAQIRLRLDPRPCRE